VVLYADFAGERHSWNGRIVRVEGEIDPVSRMVHVVAQVLDPYGKYGEDDPMPLAVGMFVEAEIMGSVVADAIVLPRTALRGERMLIVDEEDRLRFRDVDVLRVDRGDVVIVGGLDAGDRVCVSTLEAVSDGMKVRASGEQPAAQPSEDEGRQETATTGGAQ
jgi:multidrug efflux pump subunit AcrA (membrane-fusion protein)